MSQVGVHMLARDASQNTSPTGPDSKQAGFVVPAVALILLGAMAAVGVALTASMHAQSGTTRDEQSKAAFQAAEAGVNQAVLRYNTYASTTAPLTTLNPCISAGGTPAASSGGWCSGVVATVGGGSVTYYVRPVGASGTLEVVALGSNSGVTRRVDVVANSASGQQAFFDAGVKAQTGITMASNAEIRSTTATGGDMVMSSNARQCGLASVGVGRVMTLTANAAYYSSTACTGALSSSAVAQAPLVLPPVNEGDAATNNDDARITAAAAGSGSPADLVSGNRADVTWSASTRTLTINHNSALTLTGTKYSFCKVTLNSNSAIYLAAGLSVTMFFDSPEACGQSAGTVQLLLSSNSRITPAAGTPASVAMLFVGSSTTPTTLSMNSNTQVSGTCVQNFVLYAPLTDITMSSNSQYCGALASKSLTLSSNARIQSDAASQAFVLPATAAHYSVSKFVECAAASASPPNSGC